jgi:hypothetical protein
MAVALYYVFNKMFWQRFGTQYFIQYVALITDWISNLTQEVPLGSFWPSFKFYCILCPCRHTNLRFYGIYKLSVLNILLQKQWGLSSYSLAAYFVKHSLSVLLLPGTATWVFLNDEYFLVVSYIQWLIVFAKYDSINNNKFPLLLLQLNLP